MNKLKEMIELIDAEKILENEVQEIYSKLNPIREQIKTINDNISISKELFDFLCEKILETYNENELKEVERYRQLLNSSDCAITVHEGHEISPSTRQYYNQFYTQRHSIFDPKSDSWYIYDYEKEGDKVRFLVSCEKYEGHISGLMTFLDTHYTNWFNLKEIEELY